MSRMLRTALHLHLNFVCFPFVPSCSKMRKEQKQMNTSLKNTFLMSDFSSLPMFLKQSAIALNNERALAQNSSLKPAW